MCVNKYCLGVCSTRIFPASCYFYPALRLTAPVCLLGKVNLMISPTSGQITNWLSEQKKVSTVTSSWLQKHATVLCFVFFYSMLSSPGAHG